MNVTTTELAAVIALDGVPSALATARDEVDALLRDRGMRRTTSALTTESLLRGAAASAALEGSATGLDELRSGVADQVAIRAARLNAGLLALTPVVTRAPLQALARLHTLAAAGHVDEPLLGRPRGGDGSAQTLGALGQLLVSAGELPALAVAAVAHAEIATTRPFESDDGLVARALERLLLVARGVDPTSMVVPEAGHLASGADYLSALAAYGEKTPAGQRAWLLYSASALGRAAEASPLSDGA